MATECLLQLIRNAKQTEMNKKLKATLITAAIILTFLGAIWAVSEWPLLVGGGILFSALVFFIYAVWNLVYNRL